MAEVLRNMPSGHATHTRIDTLTCLLIRHGQYRRIAIRDTSVPYLHQHMNCLVTLVPFGSVMLLVPAHVA